MKPQPITLTVKDQNKINLLGLLMNGDTDIQRAQKILQCSERSLYRWMAKLKEAGPAGIIHGNRGREHPNKLKSKIAQKILKLKTEKYFDFNDIHFAEYLLEDHGIKIGRETLRMLLRSHNIKPKQKRRSPRFYSRRDRKICAGMMVQIDASIDFWLGPMHPKLTLHGGIDDATGKVWAVFKDTECMFGYYDLARQILAQDGIPLSFYSDRHTIFHTPDSPTILEQIKGSHNHLTQFGRAMQELGVELLKLIHLKPKEELSDCGGHFKIA